VVNAGPGLALLTVAWPRNDVSGRTCAAKTRTFCHRFGFGKRGHSQNGNRLALFTVTQSHTAKPRRIYFCDKLRRSSVRTRGPPPPPPGPIRGVPTLRCVSGRPKGTFHLSGTLKSTRATLVTSRLLWRRHRAGRDARPRPRMYRNKLFMRGHVGSR